MHIRNFTSQKSWFSFLLFVSVFLFFTPASGRTLSGRVMNRTLARPVAGCAVSLIRHGVSDATAEQDSTDGKGRFRLALPVAADSVQLLLSAAYAGVDYIHPITPADSGEVEIPVYEITDVDTAIAVISYHLILDARMGEGAQILIVHNRGDRTYRTGEGHGHGLEIPLPEGVTDITQGPQGLHTHDGTLVDTRPVKPGDNQLLFAFRLPPSRRIVQEMPYPIGALDVLITPPETPVTGIALQDLGEIDLGRRRYRRFSGTALKPGDRINFQIGSAAPAGSSFAKQAPWILGGVALGIGLLAVFFRAAWQRGAPAVGAKADDGSIRSRRKTLMAQIADLDDRFAEGEVAEADYQAQRATLMAEVVTLTRALGRAEG